MTPPKPTDEAAAAAADEGKDTTGVGAAEERPASTPTPVAPASPPAAPAAAPPAPLEADEDPQGYTVDDLKGQARHFFGTGTSPHAIEGALSLYPDKERFTLAEARKALSMFLKREV